MSNNNHGTRKQYAPIPTVAYADQNEKSLERRYSLELHENEVNAGSYMLEFTRDPALLHQYYVLRQEMHNRSFSAQDIDALTDEHDTSSHLLVVRKGKQVIGGVRLVISSPRKPQTLPMEEKGCQLDLHFPDIKIKEKSYCEASRIIIIPEFARFEIGKAMLAHIYRKAQVCSVHYVYTMASASEERTYMRYSRLLGYTCNKVLTNDVPIIDANGMSLNLLSWNIEKVPSTDKKSRMSDAVITATQVDENNVSKALLIA